MTPDFDELVGTGLELAEHERLQKVHELLVAAGPPAELPPHLEAGPTLAMTLTRTRAPRGRRIALLAAAVCVLAIAFLGGYLAGNNGGGIASGEVMQLAGTKVAPGALASLKLLPADNSGNWPMTLSATGLPKLPAHGYYEVFLVRNGKIFAPCGSFIAKGTGAGVNVTLNAPYKLRPHDTWVVTKQVAHSHTAGPIVLRPTT